MNKKKFSSAEDMMSQITSGADFYNEKTHEYVFSYNDRGAICVYNLESNSIAQLLAAKAEINEEHWSAYLGVGGTIYDDAADERYYHPENCTNLEYCKSVYRKKGWVKPNFKKIRAGFSITCIREECPLH